MRTSQRIINRDLHLPHLTGSVMNKPIESERPRSLIVHDALVGY